MTLTNEFFEKLQELQAAPKVAQAAPDLSSVQLYSHHFEELTTDRPFYLQNVIIAEASDEDDLKELRKKKRALPPDDMIEKAHPKSVYMSAALGDGGLVENQNEQHEKMLQVVWKMPQGNHIHLYADVLNELVKMANELESQSPEAVEAIDETLAVLTGRESVRLTKEAIAFVPVAIGAAILAALGAGGYGIWSAISGIQENLVADTQDLLSNIQSWKDDPANAMQKPISNKIYNAASQLHGLATQLLRASASLVSAPSAATQQQANQIDGQFEQLLSSIEHSAPALEQNLGGFWTSFNGKVQDVRQSYNMMHAQIAGAAQRPNETGERAKEAPPSATKPTEAPSAPAAPAANNAQRISGVQEYMAKIGFGVPVSGQADQATKSKLVQLERYLNETTENHRGLGLRNLPGNRLAGLLDTSLTATKLETLVGIFENPAAHVSV